VSLRLNFFQLPVLAHKSGVDLVVEITFVTDYSAVFNGLEHAGITHVSVTSSSHDNVCGAHRGGVNAANSPVITPSKYGDTTSKPFIHACMAQIGSISVILTISCRLDEKMKLSLYLCRHNPLLALFYLLVCSTLDGII
jgi:hypothetical protein